ncbi:MAG TPA: MFS transporter [Solirubrobacteraceae bacterium]
MSSILDLLRHNRAARRFFLAHVQSSLGNGVGYVALVLVALERFHSPWAVAMVLGADLVPLMALGPLLGGVADRLPRRACAVGADLVRAAAFAGIALTGDLTAMLVLAAAAGAGNGLFNAAVLSGLPHLAGDRRGQAATSLFGVVSTLGRTVGPVVAAALLLGGGVELALAVNGLSFLVSAALLATVDLGRAPGRDAAVPAAARDHARPGLAPGFARVLVGSSGAALFAGMANVAEPSFITDDLATAGAGFSVMVALYGLGVAAGSLAGSRGGDAARLWLRYLAGIGAMGVGYAAAAVAPLYVLALPGFALAGVGNGLVFVHERLLVQALVPVGVQGRAFGTLDMAASWAFAAALGLGALAAGAAGARAALVAAGLGTLGVWLLCALGTAAQPARRPVAERARAA